MRLIEFLMPRESGVVRRKVGREGRAAVIASPAPVCLLPPPPSMWTSPRECNTCVYVAAAASLMPTLPETSSNPVTVSPGDYAAILAALPDLYRATDMAELPGVILRLVTRLIPNVFATYNELNLHSGAVILIYHPEEWRSRHEPLMPRLVPNVHQHPIFQHVQQTGDGGPRFIADFLSEAEWLATDFGRELATIGIAAGMIFCLQTSRHALIFIALNRHHHDFTERDREVAALLRPHLLAAYDNAAAFTEAQALALLSAEAIEQSPHGVALVDADGQLFHLNGRARELIERHFPTGTSWKSALPGQVREWLAKDTTTAFTPRAPFEHEHGDIKLVVRATDIGGGRKLVLLSEVPAARDPQRFRALNLSGREAEVLHWMAEGKSNPDIGTILEISSRTVEKHIEAIYNKLGVETRTAALLKALAVR